MYSNTRASVTKSSNPVSIYSDGSSGVRDLWTNWTVPSRKRAGFYSVAAALPDDQAPLLDDLHLCVEELITEVCLFNSPVCGHTLDAADALALHRRAVEMVDALVMLPPVTYGRQPVRTLTRARPAQRGYFAPHPDVLSDVQHLLNRLHGICEQWLCEVGDYRRLVNKGRIAEAGNYYPGALRRYSDAVMNIIVALQISPRPSH